MPYMLQPKNYVQTARPNLYNVAYRRVGGYKGMGRLHPTNYLEIGARPVRFGATTGQYNTLSTQLSLLPPSLRGLGWFQRRRGLGQVDVVTPQVPGVIGTPTLSVAGGGPAMIPDPNNPGSYVPAADVGQGYATVPLTTSQQSQLQNIFSAESQGATYGGLDSNTVLLVGGGLLLLILLSGRR
jgi:hypothetical protein